MPPTHADTIAAIATARGRSALAVVRTSGPEAVAVAAACFGGADLRAVASHTAHVGYVRAADGRDVDQVVATVFRAPRSATGEDVVEVSCHGGDFAAQLILQALLAQGARHAGPGEFTQRAFLNGKLDLAQAEAVADLIHASSTRAHHASVQHLRGRYSEVLGRIRSELLDLCALVELELDFAEEDVEFADKDRLEALLGELGALLDRLIGSYRVGALLRDGVRVVIGGRPNAGKSTLLNALLGQDRAIVSDVPGTTRDEIEAEAEIEGVRFRFVDTAGLRATADAIEAEGVRRAEQAITGADVLLYVYDLQRGLDDDERAFLDRVRAERADLSVVIVGNKADLAAASPADDGALSLSAERGRHDAEHLAPLLARMTRVVTTAWSEQDASPVVMNQRHRHHLVQARAAVQAARRGLDAGRSGDQLALDLRMALHELGAITGEMTSEDVLDRIFSRFCIGK